MNTQIHFDIGSSTLGRVLVAGNDKGVCAIFMADRDNELISQMRERFVRKGPLRQIQHPQRFDLGKLGQRSIVDSGAANAQLLKAR